MLKSLATATLVGGALLHLPAFAQTCAGNNLNQTQIASTLVNKTACASRGADSWQEYHAGTAAGGDLVDYKRGPNHPVDPTEKVGTWSVSGTGNGAKVVYNYGAGGTYSYFVYLYSPTSVGLCQTQGSGSPVVVTLKSGQVPCN